MIKKVFGNQRSKHYFLGLRLHLFVFALTVNICFWFGAATLPCLADVQRFGPLKTVSHITLRPEWNSFKIIVWPYNTTILKDFEIYRKLGFGCFQIDRGASANQKYVDFSIKHNFPYYVGHAADKGFLYLTRGNKKNVTGKLGLATRPHSLATSSTIEKMKEHLLKNVTATKRGLVLAYAFDDEISLGRLVNPCDVDIHPLSLEWFRKWLRHEYGTIKQLNRQWNTSFNSFDEVMPQWFEKVRKRANKPPLSRWNLSPWMDFRHFMDFQFAAVLAELTRYTNTIDPKIPAGFCGGQGPGPWGGYDYAMLTRAVQWMEAYDIHGTNEILRSWWNKDRRPRMLTFFSTKNPKLDSWFLWYYMLHGNQAVIAWPEGWFHVKGFDGEMFDIAPHILTNRQTFIEIQGEVSEPLVNPTTVFDADPIGIYYSHPSIQAGWAMDAITHGKTWVKRTSIDNENQSKGVLRKVWCKLLEDLGFQYDFISYLDVKEGKVDLSKKFKVIILPKTICLSDREAKALKHFVMQGGTLIADYLCGLLDEHGKGRPQGILDDLFGIKRDESAGYMNGKGLTEIDGEKYEQPFPERFTYYDGAYCYKDIVVFERGTKHKAGAEAVKIDGAFGLLHKASVLIKNRIAKGDAVYLNLSPLEYWDPKKRFSSYGHTWRKFVSEILNSAGIQPRVTVYERGNTANMIECLYWKNGEKRYLGLIKNPTEQRDRKTVGETFSVQGITGQEVDIHIEFNDRTVGLINLRTNEHMGASQVFRDHFKPWEGNLYEVVYDLQ